MKPSNSKAMALVLLSLLGISASIRGENKQTYPVSGIVKALDRKTGTMTVQHEPVPGYMPAMTMPFRAGKPDELAGLNPGDEVTFTLRVTDDDSWAEGITRKGSSHLMPTVSQPEQVGRTTKPEHPLMHVAFTNQFGKPVHLSDFKGQALAITFFFTRCPVPNFCPRLSRNFQEASEKLTKNPSAPTNWHFLSVTFDTQFDTPQVLKAYSQLYNADPAHWSFLTGNPDRIRELAALSDAQYEREGSLFNHNFRTLVIDAAGRLQMSFPIGGDLSDALVQEMLKATTATSRSE